LDQSAVNAISLRPTTGREGEAHAELAASNFVGGIVAVATLGVNPAVAIDAIDLSTLTYDDRRNIETACNVSQSTISRLGQ
jgi:hypothetical protein